MISKKLRVEFFELFFDRKIFTAEESAILERRDTQSVDAFKRSAIRVCVGAKAFAEVFPKVAFEFVSCGESADAISRKLFFNKRSDVFQSASFKSASAMKQ